MDTRTALFQAIYDESEENVLKLLQSGADLKENMLGTSALILATSKRNCGKIIEHLLEYGARPIHVALISACLKYDEAIIEKLLKHGAPATEITGAQNALHVIAQSNSDKSEICELLLKYGADVNRSDWDYRTALTHAIKWENCNVIKVLLYYGANPLQKYGGTSCPLQAAFSLPPPVVQNIVKYASLQVKQYDAKSITSYLSYFKGKKSKDKRSRLYLDFAIQCIEDIKSLRQQQLSNHKFTLYDFVVSQRKALNFFLKDAEIVDHIFKLLSTVSFPIYSDVIFDKLNKSKLSKKN